MLKKTLYHKLFIGVALMFGSLTFSSCEKGLVYEKAPEATYSEVGIRYFAVRSRQLFENKIYAVNWDRWVENYIDTRQIGRTDQPWKNNTNAPVTLSDGTIVQPGESAGGVKIEKDASAPGGELYVATVVATDHATHQTANKGFLFDGSKFSGGEFELVAPVVNNRSEKIKLPVKKNELVVDFLYVATYDCVLEPINDAPPMGKPGDFTKPHRYLVKNIAYRPAGVPQATRLYELRVVFAPN